MAGVNCVIGEGAVSKDPNAVIENGKIVDQAIGARPKADILALIS